MNVSISDPKFDSIYVRPASDAGRGFSIVEFRDMSVAGNSSTVVMHFATLGEVEDMARAILEHAAALRVFGIGKSTIWSNDKAVQEYMRSCYEDRELDEAFI